MTDHILSECEIEVRNDFNGDGSPEFLVCYRVKKDGYLYVVNNARGTCKLFKSMDTVVKFLHAKGVRKFNVCLGNQLSFKF